MAKLPTRRRRSSADGARGILEVLNQDPSYVYRWVADDPQRPGRIERLKEMGYEIVPYDVEVGEKTVDKLTKIGSAVTRVGGGGVTLVLMRQLREYWEEDQKSKQAGVDALEQAMQADVRSGRVPGSKEGGFIGGKLNIHRS